MAKPRHTPASTVAEKALHAPVTHGDDLARAIKEERQADKAEKEIRARREKETSRKPYKRDANGIKYEYKRSSGDRVLISIGSKSTKVKVIPVNINELAKISGERLIEASSDENLHPDRLRRIISYALEQLDRIASSVNETSDKPRRKSANQESSVGATFPKEPPLKWPDKKEPGENSAEFTQRVYGKWLGDNFGRAEIKQLDPKLYNALAVYIGRNGVPEGMNLPTLHERNMKWAERVTTSPESSISGETGPDAIKAAKRASEILRRQKVRDR